MTPPKPASQPPQPASPVASAGSLSMAARSAKVIVVSGPSGSGKTSVLERVFRHTDAPLELSVSATTRPRRPDEVDRRDYYFLSPEEFQARKENGDFLESFEVYAKGHWYGTLKSEVGPRIEQGKWVVLDVDVQGAGQVLKAYPDAVTIFIQPSTTAVLESRLRSRGTESDATLAVRLEAARREIDASQSYQYRVINDDLDQAVEQFCRILTEIGEHDGC